MDTSSTRKFLISILDGTTAYNNIYHKVSLFAVFTENNVLCRSKLTYIEYRIVKL